MYYLSPEGKRIYTLKKVSPSGRPTVSAHPARFSPDDKYSRHRITCKRRYGLLPTQKPATQYWNFLLLLLLLLLHPTFSTFTSSRLRLANRTWISSRSIPSSTLLFSTRDLYISSSLDELSFLVDDSSVPMLSFSLFDDFPERLYMSSESWRIRVRRRLQLLSSSSNSNTCSDDDGLDVTMEILSLRISQFLQQIFICCVSYLKEAQRSNYSYFYAHKNLHKIYECK